METKALAGSPGSYRLTRPVEAIQVPATVQAMLAARIDRLSLEDKRLLADRRRHRQARAVLPAPGGRRSAGRGARGGLDRLQAAEFLYETGLFPDLEYSFKHALTQEVAYGGMLQERRRELHARIVEAIETLHQDRLGEQIERLAHHALRGELREKAVSYLFQAGLKAGRHSAPRTAAGRYEQALLVLEALPDSQSKLGAKLRIRLQLRGALTNLCETRKAISALSARPNLLPRNSTMNANGGVFTQICVL